MLRLTGTLLEPAHYRVATDGSAWLCVRIAQAGGGLPVHADQRLGQGPGAQQIAARVAGLLRRGTQVTARAKSLAIGRRPVEHLRLQDVLGIEYPTPKPRHEVAEKEATA